MKPKSIHFCFIAIIYFFFFFFETIKTNKFDLSATSTKINDIHYYIYYIAEKEIVLCSDKIFAESEIKLIPNELILDGKFTCMINLDNKNLLNIIKLHILKVKSNNNKKNLIDIFIGNSSVFSDINILRSNDDIKHSSYLEKQIFVKFLDSKIFLLKNPKQCNIEQLQNCEFIETEESLFRKKNLMLNIKLREANDNKPILLLETISNIYFIDEY